MDLAKLEGVPEALQLACQLLASSEPVEAARGAQQLHERSTARQEFFAEVSKHSEALLGAGLVGRLVQLLHPGTFDSSSTSQQLVGVKVSVAKVRCRQHRARRCPQ